jgi:selenide,water dikinase
LLDSVLRRLPRQTDANVLVGFETSDDAGVYLLTPDLALVQTVDFFTPIVDDPYTYGQIAAANSLSDVYAMGGRPLSALSIAAFPAQDDADTMERILRGGLDKMMEAGCSVVGGHTIRDEDVKFGYAVTGVVHPARIWRNVGAGPGDVLLLTKPIGTGVIATALKQGCAAGDAVAAASASMLRLNRDAAEALHGLPVHAATDVTGFGLLGHAREMALGAIAPGGARDAVTLEIDHRAVSCLPGAVEAARDGFLSGGLKNNRAFVGGCVEFAAGVPEEMRALLLDPQTSGGLLVAIAAESVAPALAALAARNVPVQQIGRVTARSGALLRVA